MESSRPNMWDSFLGDGWQGTGRHDEADGDDCGCADGRKRAYQRAVQVEAREDALRGDREETDPRDHRGEAEAERDDQEQPERDAVQRDRCEQYDERGRAWEQAAGDAEGEQAAALVVVVVVVVVVVLPSKALSEHGHADADHKQRGDEGGPGVEVFRKEELGERERHDAEREHADRVGHGHDPPEGERVARLAARTDEIGGDDRLAMARGQGVRRAPERSDQQREDRRAQTVVARDQRLEAAGVPSRHRRAPQRGGIAGERAGPDRGRRGADRERLSEQICRVPPEPAAYARGRRRGGENGGAARAADDDLSPPDPPCEVAVVELEVSTGARRVQRFQAERLEPAGPGTLGRIGLERPRGDASAVALEPQARGERPGEVRPPEPLAVLQRRDLGQVHDVVDIERTAGRLDGGVPVHSEVAERVRCGPRRSEAREKEQDGDCTLHASAFRATGAQISEKWGLSRSARPNHARAAPSRPRQRSIIPRWKNIIASRVPSRSARREWRSAVPQRPFRSSAQARRSSETMLGRARWALFASSSDCPIRTPWSRLNCAVSSSVRTPFATSSRLIAATSRNCSRAAVSRPWRR